MALPPAYSLMAVDVHQQPEETPVNNGAGNAGSFSESLQDNQYSQEFLMTWLRSLSEQQLEELGSPAYMRLKGKYEELRRVHEALMDKWIHASASSTNGVIQSQQIPNAASGTGCLRSSSDGGFLLPAPSNTASPMGGRLEHVSSLPVLEQGLENFADCTPLQKRIARFLLNRLSSEPEGTHVGAIAQNIGGDTMELSIALEGLLEEGYVYTTVDDEHFLISR